MKRSILITGSSRGIGLGIANALVDKNFNVYTNSRNGFKTLEMSGLKSSAHFSFDATSRKDVIIGLRSMATQGIVLDSLVCSVGDGSIRLDERSENWASNFDVNFLSSINVLEESLDIWPETLRNIVLISSIAGIKPMQSPPIEYSVAKAALNYYVKVKSLELAAKNISLNAVVPGNILFPNSVWEKKMQTNPKDTSKYIDNNVPLRRFGQLKDIIDAVNYLLLPNTFCSGQLIVVDGGQSI